MPRKKRGTVSMVRPADLSTIVKTITLHCFRVPQDARITTLIDEDLQHLLVSEGSNCPRAIETLKMR